MERSQKMSIEEKMTCMKVLFAKHVVLELPKVIEKKCYGCMINHPSQKQHDVCLQMNKTEQIWLCIDEALERINEEEIFQEFFNLFPDVGNEAYYDVSTFYESDEWKQELFNIVYLLF
jgi:hypothetical protein